MTLFFQLLIHIIMKSTTIEKFDNLCTELCEAKRAVRNHCIDMLKEICNRTESKEINLDKMNNFLLNDDLGFKNEKDMLSQIKRKSDIAAWALTELCTWGFSDDYASKRFSCDLFTNDLGYYVEIFKLNDGGKERYCRIEDFVVVEVNKVTKMVEVTRWEELN